MTPEQAALVQQLRDAESGGDSSPTADHHNGEPVPSGHEDEDEDAPQSLSQRVPVQILGVAAPDEALVVGSEEHAAAALEVAQKALHAAQKAAEAAQAVKEAEAAGAAAAGAASDVRGELPTADEDAAPEPVVAPSADVASSSQETAAGSGGSPSASPAAAPACAPTTAADAPAAPDQAEAAVEAGH